MSQTIRDRDNSRRVRTHEKNSGESVRRLGTIIQSIFCAGICLNFWKQFGESRYPGAFLPLLENFRPDFSPDLTDCSWVSEDESKTAGKVCFSCGGTFPHVGGRMKCPARGKKCLTCNKMNHFAKCCRMKGKEDK